MQQFRPLSSFRNDDEVDVTDRLVPETPFEGVPASPTIANGPLFFITGPQQVVRTEQLRAVQQQKQDETGTLSLITALQSTMSPNTGARMVVIPGEKKRARTTEPLPASRRRISRRVRHAIIFSVVLLMAVTTLLSLSPLATDQSNIPVLSGLGNWVRQQANNWSFQSHDAPVAAQPVNQNNPVPPPMTLPKSQYIAIAQQDATAAGISPVYFVRQINQESGFNPNAVSPAGAVGIAQFLPSTAAGLGINPWDPIQALRASAQLMSRYNQNYGGNYAKALAAYNGGPGTVTYAVNTCGAANWLNCLPNETRHYIFVIMGI